MYRSHFDCNHVHKIEEFTIRDFQYQASSKTKKFRNERNKVKGQESRLAKLVDFDINKNRAIYLTEPTFDFNVKIIPDGQPSKAKIDNLYKMEIEFVDLEKWIDKDWREMTLKEFKEVLDVCDVKFSCDCYSHWYQGHNYRLTQLDSAIYPTNIPDPVWGPRHEGKGGLCKHLLGLVNNYIFNASVVYSAIRRKIPMVLPKKPEKIIEPETKEIEVKSNAPKVGDPIQKAEKPENKLSQYSPVTSTALPQVGDTTSTEDIDETV